MFGLIKMLWKFAWLTIFILGARQAIRMIQGQMNDMIDRIEEGEAGPIESALGRLHEALHHRQVHGVATGTPGSNGVESEATAVAS